MKNVIISDAARTFDDGTLSGGSQSATQFARQSVQWRHSFSVTNTQRTSPRGGAGKRTMQSLYYSDLQEVFGKPVNFGTSGWFTLCL